MIFGFVAAAVKPSRFFCFGRYQAQQEEERQQLCCNKRTEAYGVLVLELRFYRGATEFRWHRSRQKLLSTPQPLTSFRVNKKYVKIK